MTTPLARFAQALPADLLETDPDALAPHLTDWRGQKTGTAAALVQPRTLDDCLAIVRAAAAAGVALVPQGGNTGLVGGSVPEPRPERPAILVSMRRMNRIRLIDRDGLSLVAEAGAILEDVHRAAEGEGCSFPLSLGAKGSATIGGLISTNAGGTQVLRHGPMRSLVLGLEAVLPNGRRLDQLQPLRKDTAGYDIKQLLIGAEGTLGLVTAAALRLVPRPAERAVAWAAVPGVPQALSLLSLLRQRLGECVESFELMPHDGLELVLRHVPGSRNPFDRPHPFHCLIEVHASDSGLPLADRLTEALGEAMAQRLVEDATLARTEAQARALWALRELLPEAERRDGPTLKNDVAVAVAAVPAFHAAAEAAMADAFPGAAPLVFGHLGDGNLHWNLRPPAGADPPAWIAAHGDAARRMLHDLVRAHGGTISAEHGIGTLKAAELARLGDPGRLGAMRAIKAALDPQGLFNPGKVFA